MIIYYIWGNDNSFRTKYFFYMISINNFNDKKKKYQKNIKKTVDILTIFYVLSFIIFNAR